MKKHTKETISKVIKHGIESGWTVGRIVKSVEFISYRYFAGDFKKSEVLNLIADIRKDPEQY